MKHLFLSLALIWGASAAQAGLEICNKGGAAQTVGLVYKTGKVWFSEGWWTIEPAECKVLVGGDLQQREYYYTIKNEASYVGQGYWYCAKDEPFELTGADGDCGALGASSRDYALIDTGETATSFTFDLVGSAAPSAQDAALAAQLSPAAMTEYFTRGQQGEPFFISARLQECTSVDGFDGCFVYAEGWRWAFDAAANNNPAAMVAMASLPVNTVLGISGDVLTYNDMTVDALISKIEMLPPDDVSAKLDMLQGHWVSVDDPQSKMVIYGSEMTNSYGAEVMATSVISFTDACPDGFGGEGQKLVMSQMGMPPEDALCYTLEEVTDTTLTLMYVPRGNFHTYTRQ